MTDRLFHDVEVDGERLDVRTRDGLVVEVGPGLRARREDVVEGAGGALLPGLHDHHLHLLALAAARASVDCGAGLESIAAAPGTGWIRGVRAAQSVDRHALDAIESRRPVRVQHRSGALWMLNSAALAAVAHVLDDSTDVERAPDGSPTGRLWRYDARLRPALPSTEPDLGPVLDDLRSHGITSVTDATPDLAATAVRMLSDLALPVTMLGDPEATTPWKLLLHDHDLPTYDELRDRVLAARGRDRPVALHSVTRTSLMLCLAVLDEVGRWPGDRIEHAAVVPDPLALRGLCVVTQPGFIADRGDDYARDVDPEDLSAIYPYASLCEAGVQVLPSSDAPYGPLDPWAVMRAARDRRTGSGLLVGTTERVEVARVLDGYLRDADGRRRRVGVGEPGRLVLLRGPLADVLADPVSEAVVGTYD